MPAPFGPDDADDAAGRKGEGQAVHQQAVAEGLHDAGRLDDLVPQARTGRDRQLDLVGAPLGGLGLGHELVVGGDARLALALPGAGRHPDPLELALERRLPGAVGLLLGREACLLLLEPGGVVALPGDARATIELEDPAGDVVEEVAVVGHRHDRAGVHLQRPLQPGHRLGVEMVGRLVQEQQVGLGQEQPAQRHPPSLATRERPDVGVARREAERVHGDLEGAVELPGAGGIDLGLEVGLLGQQRVDVGVGVAEGGAHLVVPVDQLLGLAHTLGHVPGDVLGLVELRLLRQVPHREPRGQPGLTGEPVVLARHDPQQRRLARAVGADDADLRPRIEGEVDALEHLTIGRVEAREAAHGVDELGSHGDQCARCGAVLPRRRRVSGRVDQRIRLSLPSLTMPVAANQRAEASSASTAGRGAYPSSSRARLVSKDIREVDIRAASSGTDGCRRRSRPSTSSETAATARASDLGTLP